MSFKESEIEKFSNIIFENIKDAGNLGTIIRSSVAFGIDTTKTLK